MSHIKPHWSYYKSNDYVFPGSRHLVLWLDSSDSNYFTLDGNYINEWKDKSGNGYTSTYDTLGSRPTLSATGIDGVRQSVFFDSTLTTRLKITNFSFPKGDEFTVFIVIKPTAASQSYGALLHLNPCLLGFFGVNYRVKFIVDSGATQPYSNNTKNLVLYKKSLYNSKSYIFENNIQKYSAIDSGIVTFVGSTLWIGVTPPGGQYYPYSGYIAEILWYNRELNVDEIDYINRYLKEKWETL